MPGPNPTADQSTNPFGKYGDLQGRVNMGSGQYDSATPDFSDLPDYLAAQYSLQTKTDESGLTTTYWTFGQDNPWSGYRDEKGNAMVQVGDPSKWKAGDQDSGIIDPSKVTYDPNLGWVTAATNVHDSGIGGPDWRMIAAVLGAGAIGTAAGLGAESGALGGVAATDAAESAGTLALNAAGTGVTPYVGTVAADAGTGALTGTMDSAGSSGFGGTTPLPDAPPVPDVPDVPPPVPSAPAAPDVPPPTTPVPPPGSEVGNEIVNTYTPGATPDPGVPISTPGTPAPVYSANPAQPGTGVFNTIRNGPLGQTLDWYNNLTPGARMVVDKGLSTAGGAINGALRQRATQQAATEAEQRARDDTIRRGQVPVFGAGAFTPKPNNPVAGIINGVRKGP